MHYQLSKHWNTFTSTKILLLVVLLWLSGCSSSGDSGGGSSNFVSSGQISGTILLPAQQVTLRPASTLLARLANILIPQTIADITGLVPVASVTVELVRLDSQGNVLSVLDTTTSDTSGVYTFITTLSPDSTLAVRLPNEPATTRAIVTDDTTDVSPVTEAVLRSIIDEIIATPATVLDNYTVAEVISMVSLINGMDIDVSGAATFDDAVNTVRTTAGSLLTEIVIGYAGTGANTTLYNKVFSEAGLSLALKDPFQLGGVGMGGVEARYNSAGYGFSSSDKLAGGFNFNDPLLHNLTAVVPAADTVNDLTGRSHVITDTNKVTVGSVGGTSVSGLATPGGLLMAFPDFQDSGTGDIYSNGLLIATELWSGSASAQDNTILDGAYNLVRFKQKLSGPTSATAVNSVSAETATGIINFDGLTDVTTKLGSVTTTGTLSSSTLALDLGTYAISNSTSASETIATDYKVIGGKPFLNDTRTGYTVMRGNTTTDSQITILSVLDDIYPVSLDVLKNDVDAAGDDLKIISVTAPSNGGTVTIAGTGTGNTLSYTPAGNYAGAIETFDYTAQDEAGLSNTATVTVNLTNIYGNATAVADSFTVNSDSSNVLLDLLANDLISNAVGENLTINIATDPTNGVTVNNGTSVSYTPNATYTGADSFTYTVSDDTSTSTPATVSITVAANIAPNALDDALAVNTNSSSNLLDVLSNDSDATGDTLTITNVSAPTTGTAVNNGTSISYTPDVLNSTPDSFTYTVSDGVSDDVATVTVTVAANAAPTANTDTYSVNNNNQGERGLMIVIPQASTLANTDITGTYNIVMISTHLTNDGGTPTTATVGSSYRYGTISFDGLGNISGGTLHRKRADLDIATALTATSNALTKLATSATPDTPTGTYIANANGSITASITIGTETLTATGAATADGQFISLAIENNTVGVERRGLLLLAHQ